MAFKSRHFLDNSFRNLLSIFATCATFCLFAHPSHAQVPTPSGLPMVFVEGYCANPDGWGGIENVVITNLRKKYPSLYKSQGSFTASYDGTTVTYQDSGGGPPVTPPPAARLFRVAFFDPLASNPQDYESFDPANITNVPIFNKTAELGQILNSITQDITHVPEVILVTHSMGGLVARAWVENLSSSFLFSHPPGQMGDAQLLLTIDTPNDGVPALEDYFGQFYPSCPGPNTNLTELTEASETLDGIEYVIPGAAEIPAKLPVDSIVTTLTSTIFPYDDVNDGIVEDYSQDAAHSIDYSNYPKGYGRPTFKKFDNPYSNIPCNLPDVLHFLDCVGELPLTQGIIRTTTAKSAMQTFTGTFTKVGNVMTPQDQGTAALLHNGQVLTVGGGTAELFNPVTNTFSSTGNPTFDQSGPTTTLLQDGRVLVAGGFDDQALNQTVTLAEIYDPVTGTFSPTGSMLVSRYSHAATLLTNGQVLISGGLTGQAFGHNTPLTESELYNPATGNFTATGSMVDARAGHTAILLNNGKVLLVGNCQPFGCNSAELYDPISGAFSLTGSMSAFSRSLNTATLLTTGSVLVTGGCCDINGGTLASAEIYDPNTDDFTPVASNMTDFRQFHAAVLLRNGQVLITGGGNFRLGGQRYLGSAELFDPITSTFTPTRAMNVRRVAHIMTALQDRTVLVTGGSTPIPFPYPAPDRFR
jgi:hypothetical protein